MENSTFLKLGLFQRQGERGKKTTLLGPLERAKLNQYPHLGTEWDPVYHTLISSYVEFRTTDKVKGPSNSER
jgi:hypothetical protein